MGCGSGEAIVALSAAGWECRGVETSPVAAVAARACGVDVVEAELSAAGFEEGSFDVVRFSHSLEHVADPARELREARRVLRPGGSLVVAVPNFGSLLARVLRSRWFYLDVPRHLWHFERRQLAELVERTGFRVTSIRCVSTGTPFLGSIDLLVGRDGMLARRRLVWLATLPFATLLDWLRLGDVLELRAEAR